MKGWQPTHAVVLHAHQEIERYNFPVWPAQKNGPTRKLVVRLGKNPAASYSPTEFPLQYHRP